MDEQIEWFASEDRNEPGESDFAPDPLYYHMKIDYKLLGENDTYIHADIKDGFDLWVPKKIIKKLTETTMYVHVKIFKILIKKRQLELRK